MPRPRPRQKKQAGQLDATTRTMQAYGIDPLPAPAMYEDIATPRLGTAAVPTRGYIDQFASISVGGAGAFSLVKSRSDVTTGAPPTVTVINGAESNLLRGEVYDWIRVERNNDISAGDFFPNVLLRLKLNGEIVIDWIPVGNSATSLVNLGAAAPLLISADNGPDRGFIYHARFNEADFTCGVPLSAGPVSALMLVTGGRNGAQLQELQKAYLS